MDIGIPPGYVNGRGGRVITTAEWEAECFAEQVAAAVMREKQEARLQKAVAAAMGTVPQPPRSEQIYRLAERIDQHLDVVEEKIEGIMVRPPSPTEIAIAARAAAYSEFAVAPPAYSEIAVAPPVYAEAPRDNLAAELAQMKAMMEQMRLEKERMETEARRKAEEEAIAARIRVEQEEARELAEIHKKLALNWYGNSWCHEQRLAADLAAGDCGVTFIKKLEAAGEIVLYAVYTETNTSNGTLKALQLLITSQKVYSFQVHTETSRTTHTTHGLCLSSGLHYMPVYTFDKPLNLKQTKMLSILKQPTQYKSQSSGGAIIKSMERPIDSAQKLEAQKKFESIIRLIPGSYQNGDWQPMDGFFGLYFNETIMEVNEFPGHAL